MPAPVSDEAFARAVQEAGVTPEQIAAARTSQAESARTGAQVSLGEVLVRQGILTPPLRESIEKKVRAQATGGLQQLGNYKLIKKLGEGGMGAVYLAEDTMLGRQVAVKVLPKKLTENQEFLARFKREAKAAGKLNHPNIVGAYAADEELGQHYYVMEYCDGEPLDVHLKRLKHLPEQLVIEVAIQVAQGLQYAHEHSIVHRDIKPANIFLTREGTAKILDLGLSKDVSGGEQSFQTVSGTALGTPHYISPEQAQGARDIDGRTDIYSLGATLYHLLTGQTPFHATTAAAVLLKHITEQLPDPRDIRPDLDEGIVHIVTKAMAKATGDRYANMAEMLADLERVKAGEAPSSAALDAQHSSIAMRAPSPPRGEGRDERQRVRGEGTGLRRTGPRPPVERDAPSDRRTGRDRRTEEEEAGRVAPSNRIYLIVGGAVAAVLLLLGLILALSGGGKTTATAKAKPDQPSSTPTPPTTPGQPTKSAPAAQPGTLNPRPETGGWPLHDGREPIADYARRVGLPPAETLDLGNGVRMELALIPAGRFTMGSPPAEAGREPAEAQHEVTITRPFYMGKHEVTYEQFGAVTAPDKTSLKGELKPVEKVQWELAQDFCTKMSAKTGQAVSLPTEAQWEYACRAGTTMRFHAGDADAALTGVAWYWENADRAPHPVGRKQPNAWGLCDMHGNVWEWCQDWLGPYPQGAVTDPRGPATGQSHVVRGGSWFNNPHGCRSAQRQKPGPDARSDNVGFRVVLDVRPPAAIAAQPGTEKGVTEAWIKSVQALPAEKQVEEVVKKLKELNPGYDGKESHEVEGGTVVALEIHSAALRDISPLAALGRLARLACVGGDDRRSPLSDLAPLRGLPIYKLTIADTSVCDLAPLRGMRLTDLNCYNAPIADLSPLQGMRLTAFLCARSDVSDISPLGTLPLTRLDVARAKVTDLRPLRTMPLRELACDFVPERDAAILRSIKTLEKINGMPAAEFWKKYPDAATAKADAGNADDEARWGPWEDLFDGKSLAGWRVPDAGLFAQHGDVRAENGELILRKGEQGTSATRAGEFPTVDYELAFQLRLPGPMVSFPVGTSQWGFFLAKDFTGEGGAGFGPVRVTRSSLSCTARGGFKVPFEEGKWHSIRLRVAAHRITAWVDSREKFEFDTTPHEKDGQGGDETLKPLAVFTWQGDGAIRAIRLRRPRAEGAQAPVAPPDDARWGPWEELFDGKSLAGWQVPSFGVFAKHGEVQAENGELLLRKGEFGTGAVWAGQCPSADYELSFELKPPATIVSFPVGTSQWGFAMHERGAGAGPLRVTQAMEFFGRGGFMSPIEKGKWYSVRLRVTARAVTGWIDGQERFTRDTTADPEKGVWGDGATRPLSVYSWTVDGAIRAIRLRRLKAEGAGGNVDNPERWKNALSLLPLVDPARDSASGRWTRQGGSLTAEATGTAAIRIPYRPPDEYDCRVEFSSDRPDANIPPATLGVILPAQGHDLNWALFQGKAGFELVDGRDLLSNSTAKGTGNWPKPKEHGTVTIQVRRTGLKTWLDGRLFYEFPTDYSNLKSHAQWNLRGAGVLGLGVLGAAVFHRCEVLEVTGRGTFTRPDDPAAKEAKKKQDEVWAAREKAGAGR